MSYYINQGDKHQQAFLNYRLEFALIQPMEIKERGAEFFAQPHGDQSFSKPTLWLNSSIKLSITGICLWKSVQ